jgi:Amt family ammonium transporter
VAICACCNAIEPYGACIIGSIAGLVYILGTKLQEIIGLDDPVDAFALHLCCGAWGLISAGFFHIDNGVFYGG